MWVIFTSYISLFVAFSTCQATTDNLATSVLLGYREIGLCDRANGDVHKPHAGRSTECHFRESYGNDRQLFRAQVRPTTCCAGMFCIRLLCVCLLWCIICTCNQSHGESQNDVYNVTWWCLSTSSRLINVMPSWWNERNIYLYMLLL